MAEQVVVDVAPLYEDRRGRGRVTDLINLVQEHYGPIGQKSILLQYRKQSCEAWALMRQHQEHQDLA